MNSVEVRRESALGGKNKVVCGNFFDREEFNEYFLNSKELLLVCWTISGNFFQVIWTIIGGVINHILQQIFIRVGNLQPM